MQERTNALGKEAGLQDSDEENVYPDNLEAVVGDPNKLEAAAEI
jgi:hypothetical protein